MSLLAARGLVQRDLNECDLFYWDVEREGNGVANGMADPMTARFATPANIFPAQILAASNAIHILLHDCLTAFDQIAGTQRDLASALRTRASALAKVVSTLHASVPTATSACTVLSKPSRDHDDKDSNESPEPGKLKRQDDRLSVAEHSNKARRCS